MSRDHVGISKFLSYILRHEPASIGLTLDEQGWAEIDTLLLLAGNAGTRIDRTTLDAVVASSDKKRFTISDDGNRIRAAQGHSVPSVSINYRERVPPQRLYHGTAERFLPSIREQGLIAGARHHVHLTENRATAIDCARRYGRPVLLTIDAARMHGHGHQFYLSENSVWLTEQVPRKYIDEL